MEKTRLEQQIAFLLVLDKMKNIYRQTLVLHEDRAENDAEHSWHLGMLVCILAEYANEPIDVCHTMKLVLTHDIVEIDAGDTYCYDEVGYRDKAEREQRAAKRLFGMLPADQCNEMTALWNEFEAAITPEARFANAVDRVQPLLLNYNKGGISWKQHQVHHGQVLARMRAVRDGSAALADYAEALIRSAQAGGMLL